MESRGNEWFDFSSICNCLLVGDIPFAAYAAPLGCWLRCNRDLVFGRICSVPRGEKYVPIELFKKMNSRYLPP
jgi:hypothetical protein